MINKLMISIKIKTILFFILVLLVFVVFLCFCFPTSKDKYIPFKTIPNLYEKMGFIILRHVNDDSTNKLWNRCYKCIRKYYPENKIMIIDDNSNYNHVKMENSSLYNTIIINSEYKKRGELLPYYYFYKLKPFDTAVILHDSVFINKNINFDKIDTYKILWSFEHYYDEPDEERKLLGIYNDEELIKFYNDKSSWTGCFGGMTIITHECISKLNNKYDLKKLLPLIYTRPHRKCFERIIACLLQKEFGNKEIFFGDINSYFSQLAFNLTYEEMLKNEQNDNIKNLPIIKVWSGR